MECTINKKGVEIWGLSLGEIHATLRGLCKRFEILLIVREGLCRRLLSGVGRCQVGLGQVDVERGIKVILGSGAHNVSIVDWCRDRNRTRRAGVDVTERKRELLH